LINTRKENNEVLYSTENFVSLTGDDLSQMKEMAKSNDRNRIRICTHQSVDDDVHEMIIYHPKDSYVPPHMHIEKDESFHLISGEITLILFNENGKINKTLGMGDYKTGKSFYYRIPAGTYHTQIFIQDTFFHEVTRGPFDKKDSIIADWAPDENESLLVKEYLNKIKNNYI
tara:strand:+ start:537 stop:1052 length:516 start_codon:yes stop_codon:yes gene_type:complete